MLPDLSAAPAGGQALGELALEAFARDVVTRVEVPGDLARGLRRLQVDDVDVPKHAFAVGSLVAIAFFERTRWCCMVPMKQAHDSIMRLCQGSDPPGQTRFCEGLR